MRFDLDQFLEDLRASLAERSRQAMRAVVERAMADPRALIRTLGEPARGGIQVLHTGADLTVINVLWAPNQITLPHNHLMTAVIGMYGGREDNIFWKRRPDTESRRIEAAGAAALAPGDAIILGRDIIHSVINPLGSVGAAIHVYDGDFLGTARSMWDPETLDEQPYAFDAVLKGAMPLHHTA